MPIGSMIDYSGASLPPGFEWPSGQTLSSAANYPEFFAVTGGLVTPDMRGRLGIPLDNLGGSAAGRLSGGVINGSLLGATGGVDLASVSLSVANLPAHQHAVFLKDNNHDHIYNKVVANAFMYYQAGAQGNIPDVAGHTSSGSSNITIGSISGVANDNQTAAAGSGTPVAIGNIQPSIMISKLLVVE